MTKPIPISAAKRIATEFGYDQVVVIARKIDPSGVEHVTTYGVNKEHCEVAAKIGDFIKFKIMKWQQEQPTAPSDMVLVPREPTEAMLEAALTRDDAEPLSGWVRVKFSGYKDIYKAMLAASEKEGT